MFAGHVGAALAIGRAERRINVGALIFSALLLDFVLWLYVLLGWESITIPANFTSTHQPQFVFPYSHGLLASIAWSALAAVTALILCPTLRRAGLRAAALIAAAVFSHWILDALVHVPELPLSGGHTMKFGLGLWQNMPVALAVEAFILVGGLCLFLPVARSSPARKFWLAALCLLVLAFTVAGMTVAPPPPSAGAMAVSSLATIIVVCALAYWLARIPDETQADHGTHRIHGKNGT